MSAPRALQAGDDGGHQVAGFSRVLADLDAGRAESSRNESPAVRRRGVSKVARDPRGEAPPAERGGCYNGLSNERRDFIFNRRDFVGPQLVEFVDRRVDLLFERCNLRIAVRTIAITGGHDLRQATRRGRKFPAAAAGAGVIRRGANREPGKLRFRNRQVSARHPAPDEPRPKEVSEEPGVQDRQQVIRVLAKFVGVTVRVPLGLIDP